MGNLKRKTVTINVDKMFFDNVFEPSRTKAQKQLGINNLTQPKFTKMMERSGFKMDLKLNDIGVTNGIKTNRKRKKR